LWQVFALGEGSVGKTWFQQVGLLEMLGNLARKFAINRSSEPWETIATLVLGGLVLGMLLVLWINFFRKNTATTAPSTENVISKNIREVNLVVLLSLYLLLPLGLFYLLSIRIPIYADRYLLIASPAYYFLVALALIKLWQGRRWWFKLSSIALLLGILGLVGIALKTYNYAPTPQKEDWRGAMQWLSQHVEPGDDVFIIPGYLNSAVDYYFKPQPGVDLVTIPSDLLDDHNDADTNAFLLNAIHDHRRAWLVVSPERYAQDEPKELVQNKWFNWNTAMFTDPIGFVGVKIYGYSFRQIPGTDKEFYPRSSLTSYNFDNKLALEGYDITPASNLAEGQVRPDDYLHLTFYWRKLTTDMQTKYQITVRLLDANGHDTNTNYTSQPLSGYFPTTSWHAGEAFRDFRDLYIHVPPGQYQLELSVTPVDQTQTPLLVSGNEGSKQAQAGASNIVLSKTITVLPASSNKPMATSK
jgi:hypothetical protein